MKKHSIILAVTTTTAFMASLTANAQPPLQPIGTWQCIATSPQTNRTWYGFNRTKALALSKARSYCFQAGYSRCFAATSSCTYRSPQAVRWSCTAYNARGVQFTRWGYAPRTNAMQNALNLCQSSPSTYNPNTCQVRPRNCVMLTN